MKSIVYFILALLTIAYIGFLCYCNIYGLESLTKVLYYLSIYGGLGIALLYAGVNFFGNPLKIVFFILLVVMVILLIITIIKPEIFRKLLKVGVDNKEFIKAMLNK